MAACAVVVVAALAVAIARYPNYYDEGLIVSGAQRILAGQVPYADFYTGYPPGQFYTVAVVFRVFGSSLMSERIWDFCWRLGMIAAAGFLAREIAGKTPRFLPLACCATAAAAQGFSLYPMVTATLPLLGALFCALRFDRARNLRWIFAAGLLLGVTAVYRHDLAACLGLVLLLFVARNGRAVLCLLAGALLVAVPVAIYFLIRVPFHFLREAFVEFPIVNAAARRLPITAARPSILLLPMIIVFGAYSAARASDGERARRLVPVAVAALSLILAMQRLDETHAFPAFALCLVILSAAVASAPQRALLLLAAFGYGLLPCARLAADLRRLGSVPPTGIERAGSVRIFPEQAETVRYIDAHVPSGGKIFVGATTHSRVSLNDAMLSFLAARPQATRYDMWVPGVINTLPVQQEMIRDLEANRVRVVVLFDLPPSAEPNTSSVDTGVRLLDEYLKVNFRKVGGVGAYSVLERAKT